MQIESALHTHKGLRRAQNQDSGAIERELGLFLVADGMGGHQGGETASRMAAEGLPRQLQRLSSGDRSAPQRLRTAVIQTNGEIHAHAERNPSLSGMGTTLTAAWFPDVRTPGASAYIAQVGDSRCYLYVPGSFWQLTVDHSYVQSLVSANIISPEAARTHPERNRINRSLGFEADTQPDLLEFTPNPGQTLLLCSDGLNSLVEDREIFEILEKHLGRTAPGTAAGQAVLEAAARGLVEAANDCGGDDNITVLLARLHD